MNAEANAAPRVLVVEDEIMVSMMLEDRLERAGYRVLAAATLDDALKLAREERIDVAVLDVNLGGQRSFPVAEALRRRGIAFTFASGYGADGLPPEYRDEAILQKPYDSKTLLGMLTSLHAHHASGPGTAH